uniref:Uncharacterized protein n=1 Tax=Pseudo-nitzschia multistriata TaxID=183589 RepID=A0A448ZHG5_9STRA
MGVFNDIASVDAFAINAYCIVSALFFSACAYAQLNDPNPVQWFCAYVFGGCVPNLYWMTTSTDSNSATTEKLVLALHGFVGGLGLAIIYKLATVAPKLLDEMTEHHHGLLWAFMEHEEGRDSCGLLLLIFHASYLASVIKKKGPDHRRQQMNGNNGRGAPSVMLSPAVLSLGLLGVLAVCVYVWVVHHPELVAKHGLKHCQGEMFGRAGEL